MTLQDAKKERTKRLLTIIIAALIGIALIVLGGNIAQTRNGEQYAERQTNATLELYANNLSENFTGDAAKLNEALTSAFNSTPVGGSEMLIVSNGRANMLSKVGSATPSIEQTRVNSDTKILDAIHTPGSGRITTNDGDFIYVTKLLDVGGSTALATSAHHMGALDESANQTRTSMIFLGLGALLIIAMAASYALPAPEALVATSATTKPDDTGSHPLPNRAPAATQVLPTNPNSESETRASATITRHMVGVPAGGRVSERDTTTTVEQPITEAHVPTAPTPEDLHEIRASDVNPVE